jgi:CpcD/allophycocyanin linker domain
LFHPRRGESTSGETTCYPSLNGVPLERGSYVLALLADKSYQIRASKNVFVPVPYSRMNEEMQRITRIGGKIVNILPLDASALKSKAAPKSETAPKQSKAAPDGE